MSSDNIDFLRYITLEAFHIWSHVLRFKMTLDISKSWLQFTFTFEIIFIDIIE